MVSVDAADLFSVLCSELVADTGNAINERIGSELSQAFVATLWRVSAQESWIREGSIVRSIHHGREHPV